MPLEFNVLQETQEEKGIHMKDTSNSPVLKAFASTDCPECGGFVALSGDGKRGETVRLEGRCPNNHLVFYKHKIR